MEAPHVEAAFRHSDHGHVDAVGEFEIQFAVSDLCIFLVQLIERAFLEEDQDVPVFLLDLPVLLFKWREFIHGRFGYEQGAWIVVRVAFACVGER